MKLSTTHLTKLRSNPKAAGIRCAKAPAPHLEDVVDEGRGEAVELEDVELHLVGAGRRVEPHLGLLLLLQGRAHVLAHLRLGVQHGVALVEAPLKLLALHSLQLLAHQAVLPALVGLNDSLDGRPELLGEKEGTD